MGTFFILPRPMSCPCFRCKTIHEVLNLLWASPSKKQNIMPMKLIDQQCFPAQLYRLYPTKRCNNLSRSSFNLSPSWLIAVNLSCAVTSMWLSFKLNYHSLNSMHLCYIVAKVVTVGLLLSSGKLSSSLPGNLPTLAWFLVLVTSTVARCFNCCSVPATRYSQNTWFSPSLDQYGVYINIHEHGSCVYLQ